MKNKLVLSLFALFSTFAPLSEPIIINNDSLVLKAQSDTLDFDGRSIEEDLKDMGINYDLYPKIDNATPQFLTSVEWFYTEDSYIGQYSYYIYIYNRSGTDWNKTGTCIMKFISGSVSDNDVSSSGDYEVHSLIECDRTYDNLFIKYRVAGATDYYHRFDESKETRSYLVSSITLTENNSSRTFDIGRRMNYSGFCSTNGSIDSSTLAVSESDFDVIRVRTYPFIADFGSVTGDACVTGSAGLLASGTRPFELNFDLFGVYFSFNNNYDQYGELYKVDYNYYKYRTDWMVSYGDKSTYNSALNFLNRKNLNSNFEYTGANPNYGFKFSAFAEYDNLESRVVDKSDSDYNLSTNTIDGYPLYSYFYNNRDDSGHHQLRIDNPNWLFDKSEDAYNNGNLEDSHITSSEVLEYLEWYEDNNYDLDESDNLPRLNGTITNDLFYAPKTDSLSTKYGYVNRSQTNDQLLNYQISDYLNGFPYIDNYSKTLLGISSDYITFDYADYSESTKISLGDIFRQSYENDLNLSKYYPYFNGTKDLSLKNVTNDYQSDFIYTCIEDEFLRRGQEIIDDDGVGSKKMTLNQFIDDSLNNDKEIYRMIYDYSLSNSYIAASKNYSDSAVGQDGTWTGSSVAVSKTDVIFDFQFIDFTFKNEKDETFILPVASHPFTISGTPEIPDSEADSLSTWAITLIVIACLVLVLGILGIFFPVIFSAVKVVFKVLVKVLEVIFTIIYFILVWWWLAIIQKIRGEEIPRIWLFD